MKGQGNARDCLRLLPGVDRVLGKLQSMGISPTSGVTRFIRRYLQDQRQRWIQNPPVHNLPRNQEECLEQVVQAVLTQLQPSCRQVINATGIFLHTNLGRAPLSQQAREALMNVGSHYYNLEYDLHTGRRGSRQDVLENLLKALTGAPGALVVNNNAAAVLLILNSLAREGEVLVSRGELVEIGGSFRVPDIMKGSGAILREVGTTNRTRIQDYEEALTPNTTMVMKVHPSNYRIRGFTEEVDLEEMQAWAHKKGLLFYYDLGSSSFWSVPGEPALEEVAQSSIDVFSFSGDKLLGGSQAGIILGQENVLKRMRGNYLHRALRIDKLSLCALEATLRQYLLQDGRGIPVHDMYHMDEQELQLRTEEVKRRLQGRLQRGIEVFVEKGVSYAGGGTLPETEIPGPVLTFRSATVDLGAAQSLLRQGHPPLIVNLRGGTLEVNLRTVFVQEEEVLIQALLQAFTEGDDTSEE